MSKIKLDGNTRTWIEDRIDHREPLMWAEFITFRRRAGEDKKTLKRYQSKSYRNAVKREYKREKD